jgi:hypothetical protein
MAAAGADLRVVQVADSYGRWNGIRSSRKGSTAPDGAARPWNSEEMPTLARYVMPHAPEIEHLLAHVRQSTLCELAKVPDVRLASHIYRALASKKIVWDYEPVSLGKSQRMRLPHQVFPTTGSAVGTCLDLSDLFAGCFEGGYHEPLVFQFVRRNGDGHGHALAGFWLRPPSTREVVYRDARLFSVGRPRNVVVVDVIGVSVNSPASFRTACRAARAMFTDPTWSFRFALDVALARSCGIMPWDYPND